MDYLKKYINMYWKKYIVVFIFLTAEATCDLLQPTIMSKIIDKGVGGKDINYVLKLGGLMLLITGMGAISAVVRNIISSNVSQKFGRELRFDLFKKVQSFSFDNVDKFHGASLMTRLTSDVTQVQNFAHGMMRIFIKAPILCIGSIVMASLINPSMSLILIGVVPIVAALIFINMKFSYPFFIKVQKALDKVNGVMREYLAGIRVVKAFNRFSFEIERFEGVNSELAEASTKGMRVMSILNPSITLTVNIGIVLVLWFGGVKVNGGNMKVGQIIAFINYMTQILFSLMMLSHVFTMFIRAKASAERIGEVFSEESSLMLKDSPVNLERASGTVDFEEVYFSYDDNGKPVLKDITFHCEAGETIGIIGSTGSGKSSLVNLIPRFYDVTSGTVKVDGIDVRDMDIKSLREIIAIVPQKTTLFSGSILDNIRWGDKNATIDEVKRVAKVSKAHEFISSFPEGYNTILGQGGVNLSGGQKQRLSIARALVRKPKILILDDCTSAVDVTTESDIRKEMKSYLKDITCILIAQRITSVMSADRIMVLDNGVIIAMGSHEELMNSCDVYKDIFYSQIGKRVM
ncbi:ABC transporter ATP-binding protein [Clostridium amazonitimonense]|uniref:ABC transporter ATP-binding protein n=1 Tax=Clostridium amazonitimonense TaxID=1499689 RepID=UPI00050944A6|nr:ABC transporter ATP-binding protein [Clostridium amazonitimonense]